MGEEDRRSVTCAQAIQNIGIHRPKDVESPCLARLHRCNKADTKHQYVHDEQHRSYRGMAAEKAGEPFAERGERKAQARAAFVAARCLDSHERAAGGTNFRARLLLLAAAEKSAHRGLPFFHSPLPPVGKRQFSSLRPANSVPIIPKSPRFFPARSPLLRQFQRSPVFALRTDFRTEKSFLPSPRAGSSCSFHSEDDALMDRFEEFGKRIDEEIARLKRINNFEDFGRRVDEELTRVKSFVKEEVAPETEKRAAQFLREVSEKLAEAAGWIEARQAARNAQNAQNPRNPSSS